jgi:hypothetical protein
VLIEPLLASLCNVPEHGSSITGNPCDSQRAERVVLLTGFWLDPAYRGWHMEEKHFIVDGEPCSASLFDFGLYFFHNARYGEEQQLAVAGVALSASSAVNLEQAQFILAGF